MSERFWTQEAIKYSGLIVRTMPAPHRGVMAVAGREDVLCLYAPYPELDQVKQRLEDAGIGILGTGVSVFLPGESVFAMLVQSADEKKLSEFLFP
jgi:hypothetical protein